MTTHAAGSGAKAAMRSLGRGVLCYLVASAVQTAVHFEWVGGHPHVPFTQFPWYFVLTPVGPIAALSSLFHGEWGVGLAGLAAFAVTFFGAWQLLGRWMQRSPIAR
jgi:hypothetical protein